MKRIIKILFLCLVSFCSSGAIPDSLINPIKLTVHKITSSGIHIGVNGSNKHSDLNWLFFPYDDYKILLSKYNDIGFKVITDTDFGQEDEFEFKGVCWYKLYFKISTNELNKIIYLNYEQTGASEIYLDKKLIKSFGATDFNGKTTASLHLNDLRIPFCFNDTFTHSLSIRYSLSDYEEMHKKYNFNHFGPILSFNLDKDSNWINDYQEIYYSIMNMLAAFFFSLFIIHLLIYLFYKEKNFNLQYSLFLLFLSLCFFEVYFAKHIEETHAQIIVSEIDNLFFPICCFLLITLLYKFLNKPKNKSYYLFSFIFILLLIDNVFFLGYNSALTSIFILYAYFSSLILAIKGVKRRVASGKFLGWGILGFTLSLVLGLMIAIVFSKLIHPKNQLIVFYFWIFDLILSVLSIPLSMTAYLAYDFAFTNKSLTKQLSENDELSKKSMQQEKEKQDLLANQNKILEVQVSERTKEIGEQNKMLELQKKEITDSINYAKRIQQALLPDLETIQKKLPNSFVLYLPKDIVSGDFYFFYELINTKNSNELLIAAADCTGHGVPGSLMSMIVHEKLCNAVNQTSEPAEILQQLNKQVKDALKQHDTENASRDGCDIAICKITENTISYSGAYRPLYLFNKKGEFSEIKATKTAIAGLTPYDQEFKQTELETKNLKAIYLCSDGFADQFGGEKSKKLTTKKFKLLLTSLINLPVNEQKFKLESFFNNWRGEVEQIDDILIIGITFI